MLSFTAPLNTLAQSDTSRVPLFEGLGGHQHSITTDSELAQRYFDQGLMKALRRQGNVEETEKVRRRFLKAYQNADLVLTDSRL